MFLIQMGCPATECMLMQGVNEVLCQPDSVILSETKQKFVMVSEGLSCNKLLSNLVL